MAAYTKDLDKIKNMKCKFGMQDLPLLFSQSPRGSSSSSSSSDGDEEEGESGGEPPGQKRALLGGKSDCPPPSYPHTQVEDH